MSDSSEDEDEIKLTHSEIIVLCNMYLALEYPNNMMTIPEATMILQLSQRQSKRILQGLQAKGLVYRIRSIITCYRPIEDNVTMHLVLHRIGALPFKMKQKIIE